MLGSHLGLDVGTQNALDGSQRSFFPWDHAGASSSVAGTAFSLLGRGSDRGVDRAEVKLRSLDSPFSRRESSYMASQVGSAAGKAGFSPMTLGRNAELVGEDFAFQGGYCHFSQSNATLTRSQFLPKILSPLSPNQVMSTSPLWKETLSIF